MDEDSLAQKLSTSHQLGTDLAALSVDELEALVQALEVEKTRVLDEIKRKKADLDQANALFS